MIKKKSKYLLNLNEPYKLKLDNMIVELEYADTQRTFKECMLNILKQKKNK